MMRADLAALRCFLRPDLAVNPTHIRQRDLGAHRADVAARSTQVLSGQGRGAWHVALPGEFVAVSEQSIPQLAEPVGWVFRIGDSSLAELIRSRLLAARTAAEDADMARLPRTVHIRDRTGHPRFRCRSCAGGRLVARRVRCHGPGPHACPAAHRAVVRPPARHPPPVNHPIGTQIR